MKYKIVEHINRENGLIIGYELKRRWLFFLPWKSMRFYKTIHCIEHDVVWLLSMDGRVKLDKEFD